MNNRINYNHHHRYNGESISSTDGDITVKDLRDAIAEYPDDADVILETCGKCGCAQRIVGFKSRADDVISIRTDGVE